VRQSFVRRSLWVLACAAGLWAPAGAIAQGASHQVTGTVSRATGEGIPAASVIITGTQRGTQTDNDGHFKLIVPNEPTPVTVRSIGFLPKNITIGPADSKVQVTLVDDPAKLEQVVVTGLATGVQKASATTSTVAVDSQQLTRAAAPTVDMALQDKVPGAQIESNSGSPGGGMQVQIRGVNTVIGASDPLFVVDGIIYSNATVPSGLYNITKSGGIANNSGPAQDDAANRLADLDPNDIASIQILKSAAASSIYGSKAANGVVIITTKHGAAGKPKFDITQRTGFAHLLRGPGERVFTVASADSLYGSSLVQPFVVGNELPYYNHLDEVAGQTPIDYETTLDVTGGNESTRYYGSADITADGGIMQNSDATRQSARANIDQQIAKHLEANFNLTYTHNIEDRGVANNDNSGASVPYALAYIPSFEPITPVNGVYPLPAITYIDANPLQTEQYVENREEVSRFTGGGRATYDALSTDRNTLQFIGDAGIDFFNDATNVAAPAFLYFEQASTLPGVASVGQGLSQYYNWDVNVIHTYTDPLFKATTSIGTSFEDRTLDLSSTSTSGLVGTTTYIDNGVAPVPYENNTHERTVAFYGDEQFTTLSDRLLLDVGLRGERSSANGDADQFFYYPKYSASYRVPLPSGFTDATGTELKLRVAYGMTGNQPLFGQKYTLLNTPCIGGACGTAVNGGTGTAIFGNSSIRPETTRETELGTDISTWNGRADLEFTYYHRITSDLLLPRTPAPSTGYAEIIGNGGDFMNEGIEIGGNLTPVRVRNFSWTFTTSFQTLHNIVLSLPAGITSFEPFGAGFGLAYGEFLVQTGRPITQIIGQTSFNSAGGFNVTEMGQYNPDYRWSFGNSFQLPARFNLYMLWDWQKGGVEENQTYSLYSCNGLDPNMDNAGGQQAFQDCNDGIANPFVTNMTFVKLRELRLSYDLPVSAARTFFGSESVSLNVSGRNLILWTPYFGYDPEVSNYGQEAITRGIDLGQYPPSRTFLFSVSARF
jgi:TonB-dependent starch-binding outer membrane protein SusC